MIGGYIGAPIGGGLPTIDLDRFSKSATILLASQIIETGKRVDEGVIVRAVTLPWFAIVDEIRKHPNFLREFANYPRKFEEFVAAAYERAGFEVVLTPQSGDKGRDVIAVRQGQLSLRILDQVKAYSPGNAVTAEQVRSMLGVLSIDTNTSKAVITTTSDFASGVSQEFASVIPHRLELRDGKRLIEWLEELRSLEKVHGMTK